MACIVDILTCIYKDFDLQQVVEASTPNLIFMRLLVWFFKNMLQKQTILA